LTANYLIDTNILIYHTTGSKESSDILNNAITQQSFNISIITKIEFLGWDKHTVDGFEKCKKLIESATIYSLGHDIAEKAIQIKKEKKIKLADAVIAATAILNNLVLVTRNTDDFKEVLELKVINPFE
jgi:predicted nucleic acid-binding protein